MRKNKTQWQNRAKAVALSGLMLAGCIVPALQTLDVSADAYTEAGVVATSSFDNGDSNPDAVIPVLMEDYRVLYHPTNDIGMYMNDHTVFKTQNAQNTESEWNVIGITNVELKGGDYEKWFANGVGANLDEGYFSNNPSTGGKIMDSTNQQADPTPNPVRPGTLCWAPYVVYENSAYHMFYYSNLEGRWDMGYAVSTDLVNWDDRTEEITLTVPDETKEGLLYVDGNLEQTRDPMLIKYGNKWLLYATSQYDDNGVYRGAVAVYESENLLNWTFVDFALKNLDGAPLASYSTCESPFVIKKGDKFILALTETNSKYDTYHDTILFISDDPYNFGTYSGANNLETSPCYLGRLPGHCSEFIHDEDTGKWYMTTGGWRNLTKFKGSDGGVGIAEIQWMTPEEYETYKETVCDGHETAVLNHSFENGTLENWVTTGDFGVHMVNDSFKSASGVYRDMVGKYTFCSYSDGVNGGDTQVGSMASNIFTLKENAKMSFYVAGGNNKYSLYIALINVETQQIIHMATGNNSENAKKVVWDLSNHAGEDVYILIVDKVTGAWGHIGVDCIEVDGVAKNEWISRS